MSSAGPALIGGKRLAVDLEAVATPTSPGPYHPFHVPHRIFTAISTIMDIHPRDRR
jgi:hypothetical protein